MYFIINYIDYVFKEKQNKSLFYGVSLFDSKIIFLLLKTYKMNGAASAGSKVKMNNANHFYSSVSRNRIAFAQNKVNAFFVCSFVNLEKILI